MGAGRQRKLNSKKQGKGGYHRRVRQDVKIISPDFKKRKLNRHSLHATGVIGRRSQHPCSSRKGEAAPLKLLKKEHRSIRKEQRASKKSETDPEELLKAGAKIKHNISSSSKRAKQTEESP